jgi:hypothetical protein
MRDADCMQIDGFEPMSGLHCLAFRSIDRSIDDVTKKSLFAGGSGATCCNHISRGRASRRAKQLKKANKLLAIESSRD